MAFLLDTNPCIGYLNGRSDILRRRIDAVRDEPILVSSIVKGELFFGAIKSRDPATTLALQREFLCRFGSLPFDDQAAEAYGRIRADLERRGATIGANDLMIAATALANHATLVTHNTAEFSRVPDLAVEDWETES